MRERITEEKEKKDEEEVSCILTFLSNKMLKGKKRQKKMRKSNRERNVKYNIDP